MADASGAIAKLAAEIQGHWVGTEYYQSFEAILEALQALNQRAAESEQIKE